MNEHDTRRERQTAARALTGAAGVLRRFGWHQHAYWVGADTGRGWGGATACCAVGAVAIACGITQVYVLEDHTDPHSEPHLLDPVFQRATTALARALQVRGIGEVESWNDQPERTVSEVLTALRTAVQHLSTDTPHRPGGPSAKTFHPATGNPNHQNDSEEHHRG